jgi:hypothetical protein
MRPQRAPAIIWLIGRTRRERVASALAVLGFCLALFWALLNGMNYGYEETDPRPSLLHTNGRFAVSLVLGVFFSFVAVGVLGAVLFWYFRFVDRGHRA